MQNNYANTDLVTPYLDTPFKWLLAFSICVNRYEVHYSYFEMEEILFPNRLLLEALEGRWKNYRLELKRCRTEFSNETVHDVRVALRRLLSVIQLLDTVAPRPRLRKLRRVLKAQIDDFDELRDTQVMLAEITETIQELPQLETFQRQLERAEKRLLKGLRKKRKNLDLKEVTRRIRKTHDGLKAEEKADFAEPVFRSMDDAFAVMWRRYEQVDPEHPSTIHRLRVAFKKFRYTVEIIHPLLADFPLENLKRMHDYQSLMGEIQDADVFLQTLDEFQSTASSSQPEPVRSYYESRHTDAISAYIKDKDILKEFWRPAPNQPFPWEKTK